MISCSRCGETWPRDPALEVACPDCKAPVGARCKRPSGHGCDVHHARDALALSRGLMRKCQGGVRERSPGGRQTCSAPQDDVGGAPNVGTALPTPGERSEIVPTVDGPRVQLIVPGAGRSAAQARQKRENSNGGRVRKGANLPLDFGLFGSAPERDLFDKS